MIGGQDHIIPTANALAALEHAMRMVRRIWHSAVFEDGRTGEPIDPFAQPSLLGRREVLAFKDAAASRLWEEVGADETTRNTLIHLLISQDELTVVVDDEPSPEMQRFLHSLSHALKQDLFSGYPYVPRTAA
jgi:hypothetical protein